MWRLGVLPYCFPSDLCLGYMVFRTSNSSARRRQSSLFLLYQFSVSNRTDLLLLPRYSECLQVVLSNGLKRGLFSFEASWLIYITLDIFGEGKLPAGYQLTYSLVSRPVFYGISTGRSVSSLPILLCRCVSWYTVLDLSLFCYDR
jgi:hypothetical protein